MGPALVGWAKARPSSIENRFVYPIDPQQFLPLRIGKGNCTKGRESAPGRGQTKGLAKMSGLEKNGAVNTRKLVFPASAWKHRSHQNEEGSIGKPPLVAKILLERFPSDTRSQPLQFVAFCSIVINPVSQSPYLARDNVSFDRMQAATGR